jgi:GT2 family glycosyltransferase
MDNLDLCVVIPTFNRKEALVILLTQLKQQKIEGVEFRIVVVVDGSTDGTLELLQNRFAGVHVIKGNGNWWFTRSLNEGCRYAVEVLKAKLILTLNDDVQIPENYLQEIIRNYNGCDPNSVIGSSSYSVTDPKMITFSGFKGQNRVRLKYHKYYPSFSYMQPGQLKGIATSITLPTRGMLMPSAVMKSIHYLDERAFPQYGSDYDCVFRAAKMGSPIYVSYDAYVYENMQLTSSGNPRLSKSFISYMRNVFFNKYSSTFFFNKLRMAWRYGIKILFPYYCMHFLVLVPYIYIKYKYSSLNKKLQNKN